MKTVNRRTLAWLLPLVLLGSGCLVIPIPTNRWDPTSRRNVDATTTNALATGQDTREQVLLRLGEPDESTADDRKFRYHTERVQWDILWAVGGGYNAAGGDIEVRKHRDLLLGFDEAGKLRGAYLAVGYDPDKLRRQFHSASLFGPSTNTAPSSGSPERSTHPDSNSSAR